MSNYGAQNVPQMGIESPKGGQNSRKRGKFVRDCHRIYHTATNIYSNVSVHNTIYAINRSSQFGSFPPFGA